MRSAVRLLIGSKEEFKKRFHQEAIREHDLNKEVKKLSEKLSHFKNAFNPASAARRGDRLIQARQLVFQSYYCLLAHKFSNGSSLRLFQGKDMSSFIPSFIHSRYTVVSQNSILLCHFQCL